MIALVSAFWLTACNSGAVSPASMFVTMLATFPVTGAEKKELSLTIILLRDMTIITIS